MDVPEMILYNVLLVFDGDSGDHPARMSTPGAVISGWYNYISYTSKEIKLVYILDYNLIIVLNTYCLP